MDKAIVDKIYSVAAGAVVTFATGFALKKIWKVSTGDEPPNPEDPEVPIGAALAWFLASGVGIGLAQMMTSRRIQKHLNPHA
ncbi:MAG: DUF4235 domain-containing protein [Propionibacteriaceae bacterium]|jgi:hypothetical protein|nr:DUF4235 domain-containing protein [Propionibacteriaceae bacterium]